jgi:tetratricopeptide (TPR) repeat protein
VLRLISLALFLAAPALADPPKPPSALEGALEPDYAEAILKFQRGAHADAIQSLQKLLDKIPASGPALRDRRRVLELQALAHRLSNNDERARALHERILALVKEQGADEKEGAPSIFELALIDFRQGRGSQARDGFEHSLKLDYNRQACQFLLGYLDLEQKETTGAARRFRFALAEPGSPELHALSAQYLSRLASDEGDAARALRYAEQGAKPEVGGAFREYADFSLRMDTNSAFLPLGPNPTDSGFTTNDGDTAASTELNAWLGYVSSPLDSWQWSLGSRTRILSHFGAQATSSDFLDQGLELDLGHRPLEPVSYGFRAALEMLWASADLDPYRLQGVLGVYFRRELRPALVLKTELDARPSKNYFDSRVPDLFDRSGPSYDLRVSLFTDTAKGAWNPGLSVWMGLSVPSGREFRARAISLETSNLYFAGSRWRGSMGSIVGLSAYVDRPEKARYDPFFGLDASAMYSLSQGYSLRAAASWLGDFSNVGEPYRFNRLSLSAGLAVQI